MSTLQNRITQLSPAKLALLSQRLKEKNIVEADVQSIPRRNSAEPAPLSYTQQRLWFLDQLDPGSVVYNLRETTRRRGRFEMPVLVAAVNEVVRRHEILRTSFETIHGRAVQVVAPAQAVALPLVDLSALPEPEKEAQRLMYADGSRSFDLARGPLFRVTVLKLAEEDHIVVLTMHHIIFDGWSIGVFMKEVAVLYNAFSQGLPSPLPELPVQYADYAMWQREWLQGEVLEQHIGYWKKQLEGAPELLLLPIDRPRPAVQTHSGANVGMVLSRELTAKLHELCRAEGATPYMLLLAVFKVLLARYTGQEDISVGTPIAGRNRVETENLIGCFLNTLVLRTDLSGNPTARELVQRVREVALGAYAHQEVPFEKLLDELRVARSLSHSPLFQVMFNMVNFPGGDFDLKETESPLDVRSKFDLTLYVNDKDDGIQFTLIYNPDLFKRERIVEMLDQFKHLLAQVSDNPSIEITRLSLVTPGSAKLLPEPAQTIHSHWSGAVHQLFAEHARKSPDRLAVTDKQETWTYGQIEERSNQLANYLRASGIRRQDVVAVYAHRSATLVWAIYGILKAGATFLILDPAYPELRLIDYLRAAKPRGWLQLEEAGAIPPALEDFVETLSCRARLTLQPRAASTDDTLVKYPVDDPRVEIGPDDIACITFTSGSSGTPKGVLGRHIALTLFANWTQKEFAISEQDRFSMLSGLAHDPLQRDIFTPLQLGASLSIPDPKEFGTPGWLARWMKHESISVTNLTPAMGQMITETADDDELSSLRYAFFVGDKLTRRDVARLGKLAPSVTSINLYGTTETQRAFGFYAQESTKEELPVGRGIDGVQLLVLNAAGQLAGIGELGEIYFRSPYLARGYNEDDELTQQRFITNPFTGIQDDRLYKTGDVGRYLPDGNVEMAGRMDHQVKVRGFRIELGEIESAIAEHPAVQDCAVLAREDQPGDKRLVAYLVFKHDCSVTTAELRSTLKKRLPDYMVPAHFVVLDEMPLTPNGKLNRLALPAPVASRYSLTQIISPRTPVEEVLAGIWCDVLRTTGIGVDDNFFELGGHSLLATQVVSRIREAFSIEISVRAIFERQTIAMLAAEVERLMYQGGSLQAPPVVRTSREVELPLSFAQQRLWFIDRLIPESPLYNMPMAVRLDGTLKLDALERTLREIVRRHEVLRTSFVTVKGKPLQVIRPEAHVDEIYLPLVDLSSLPGGLREVEAKRLARVEAARPFDLETDTLLRATVLRLDDQQHIAMLTFHHIIFDGWSIGVFVREVAALYNAFSQGLPSPLAELPVQYADYAVWQREWLQGEVLAQHIGYWKQQLEGAPELLELPTDRPRPAVQTHHGAKVGMVLSKKLTGKLREVCRAEGATLFMVLLATFKVLLARYTGQEDISVGTPIAGRNRVETEGLIGFFVNTLVLRTDLSSNPTVRELIRRVREVALGAYAHQELPFEKLVDELQVERSLSHMPLFQVLFALQNATQEVLELPGLSLSAAGETSGVANCDLGLNMSESDEAISGVWEYNTDLFDETTIKRLVGHFKTLLESFVSDPGQRLSKLQMLTEAERQRTLCEWSKGTDETAAFEASECLHDLFEAQVERTPDAIAVVFDEKQISYRELNRRANQLAHYLQSVGVREESLVGLLVERSVEMLVGVLGVLKAGAAYVPLDPSYPQERLSFMLEDAGVEVLLTQQHLAERFASASLEAHSFTTLCLDSDWTQIAEHATENPVRRSVASNAAYVIYTSGSTGKPKGVVVTHAGVVNLAAAQRRALEVRPGTRVLQCASLSFDISVWEIFVTLLNGGTLCVPKPETQMAGPALHELLQQQSIELVLLTPTVLTTVASEGLPCLRTVMSGAEACPAELAARWSAGRCFINAYGPTEITVMATMSEPLDGERLPPIGRPIANMQAYVLDQYMQPVAVGVAGELYVGGAGVTRGYLRRPELTAEKFVPHPYSERAGARLYRTGDVVRQRADGELEYLGRLDDQVKLRGFRIELGEIANALREQAGVRECVVVALGESGEEKRLVAYVVADEGVNARELRGELERRLPQYMIPAAIVLLAELPLARNGKVDRRALPAPEEVWTAGEENFVAPRTPVEEILAGIWSEVLRLTRIGVNDNFFELGGHSLLATQVVSRIREAFAIEISVRAIFEKQTLAMLAAAVEQQMYQGSAVQAAPVVRRSRDVELPVSFAQQRLWFIDHLTPGSPLYNIPMAVRLDGALNLDALERTLREIVRRHEVLRTNFVMVDGQPVQVIRPEAHVDEICLPLVDLGALPAIFPETLREVEAKRLARAEAARPFDLAADALLRMTVLRLDDQQHIALLTLHHIIFDGWSMGVLVREVASLYSALSQGLESPLPELPVQYADYAVWQREWAQGEVLEQQIGYWKQQLEGAPALLELPADRPRPAVQTHRGARVGMALSPELTAKVRELCRAEGTTLFMLLLAVYKVLLARYTGQEDISVGTPIAGRNRVETEGLIGFFVNTLVLRTDLSGNPTARELLRRVREVALGAYAHQELPFEKLVDELQVERRLSHTPLFQVFFALQNATQELLELPGLSLSAAGAASDVAKFDLTLSMSESGEAISGALEYNTDLFDETTIKRLVGHFKILLESFVSDPALRLSQLQMLTSTELQRTLYEWSEVKDEAPAAFEVSECLPDLFEAQVRRTPDAIAVVFDEQQISYRELNSRANQLAHHLQNQGVREESLVGILVERSVEMLVGILGVLKAGAAYLPLDPSYPQERLSFMVADAGVEALLTQQHLIERFASASLEARPFQTLCVDHDWAQIAAHATDNPARRSVASNAAYVIYTSGSTGRPKGVVVPHAGAFNLAEAQRRTFDVRPGTRVLQFASLSFDASVSELFVTLLSGATLCVPKPETQMAGAALYELLQQQAIEVVTLPPTVLATLESEGLPCLRTVITAGEACTAELAARWSTDGRRFINAYGPTETTVCATMSEPLDGACQPPIGRPMTNMQVYVLDRYLQPVAVGVVGELYVGGVGVTRGYLRRPELTAEKFVPHPFSLEAGARLYRTGDYARYLADGQLEYIGRIDEQVKLRGLRIELNEIEAVLLKHESVREAVVVVRADESGEHKLVAYLVTQDDAESQTSQPTTSELRRHAKQFLPEYMVPSTFLLLESLPVTPAGKVDKKRLPAPTNERPALASAYVRPQTETEQSIAAVWQELLHLSEVGTEDNFFDLGGNSLLLMQVSARLQKIFGEQLTIIDLFEHPTIGSLAARLSHEVPSLAQDQRQAARFAKKMTRNERRRQKLERKRAVWVEGDGDGATLMPAVHTASDKSLAPFNHHPN